MDKANQRRICGHVMVLDIHHWPVPRNSCNRSLNRRVLHSFDVKFKQMASVEDKVIKPYDSDLFERLCFLSTKPYSPEISWKLGGIDKHCSPTVAQPFLEGEDIG